MLSLPFVVPQLGRRALVTVRGSVPGLALFTTGYSRCNTVKSFFKLEAQ